MNDDLKNAQDLLLNKTFMQKGVGFENFVEDVTLNPIKNEILVGYKTTRCAVGIVNK